jgi:cytochrome c
MHSKSLILWSAVAVGAALPTPAQASALMALDKGCMGCHGTPPRHNTPSMEQLAADYAKFRSQPDAAHKLAAKLREGGMFGHIAAHERLSTQDAEKLMQWIVDGAK